MEENFKIGKVVNTHGLKGEVKVYPYTETPEKFHDYDKLYIKDEIYEVKQIKTHKNMVIVKLKGMDHIDQTASIMNEEIIIKREWSKDDGEGHYIVDLIGCQVFDHENGQHLGTLVDVLQNSSQDLYEIKHVDTGKLFYIPVVDAFVKAIDVVEKRIEVVILEGLIE